jgi:hypothetical protein
MYPYLYPVQMAYGIPSPRRALSCVIIQPSTVEPVSLDAAKQQLRITADQTDDDNFIIGLIATGRRLVERRLGITLAAARYKATFPDPLDLLSNRHESNWWGWSDTLELPYPPLLVDTDHPIVVTAGGTTVDPTLYTVDQDTRPGRLRFGNPGTSGQIIVTFWAGAAAASSVPPQLKTAILMIVAHLWAHREAVTTDGGAVEMPMGVDMLLASEALTGLY